MAMFSLIFAIRGATIEIKNTITQRIYFIAASSRRHHFTAAMTAVAGLITYMTMLRSDISRVVDEIRKIPEIVSPTTHAQMAEYKARLYPYNPAKNQD
ncbi:hypothetical protein QM042_01920 [Escherichia coli]|uniref:hypothetical protein n=1 Tax=Escherichia coli TaxID=562 RepID=UPI003985F0F8